eukprot:COSAG01_NODE_28886_length_650_cov_1.005445_2_plen_43_part_01
MALRVQVNLMIYSHRFHVRMCGKVGARLTVAILGFSITPTHVT